MKKRNGVRALVLNGEYTDISLEDIVSIVGIEGIAGEVTLTVPAFPRKIHKAGMAPRICPGDIVIARQQSGAGSVDM